MECATPGARVAVQLGEDMVEAVWVPWLTPSRTPLLDQRWTVVPEWASGLSLVDISGPPPEGAQAGLRWSHTGTGYELAISFFDGFKHLPNIDVRPGFVPTDLGIVRRYPDLRSYGFDIAVPTRWFTLKTESSYATSSTAGTDEYVLYVVQLERQTGEWLFVGGYAGEIVTADRAAVAFAPDRGLTRAFVGRASYTLDVNRSWAVEGAVRQNAHGAYVKGEYSQARGQHWRATLSAALIAGRADDFLGQYRRNSHLVVTLRYSF